LSLLNSNIYKGFKVLYFMVNEHIACGFHSNNGQRKETDYDCYIGKTVNVNCGNLGGTGILKDVFKSYSGWVFHLRPYNAEDPETEKNITVDKDKVVDVPSNNPHTITELAWSLEVLVDKLNKAAERKKQGREQVAD